MSSKGEIIPELAEKIRAIAERVANGTATKIDAHDLKELAKQLEGSHPRFTLKVHLKKGRPRKPLDERLEIARAIEAYMVEHDIGSEAACAALALTGKFHAGESALRKVWQEIRPILEMDDEKRQLVIAFKRLEDRGLTTVTKIRTKK